MNLLIIILLGFIAAQLFQFNLLKKKELSLHLQENEEEKVRDYLPHIFRKSMTDDAKNELTEFYRNRFGDQPHLHFINTMEEAMNVEQNQEKKKYMRAALARMKGTQKILNENLTKEREATYEEILYILFKYYRSEFNSFPRESATVNPTDEWQIESYLALFPVKVCK